MSPQNAFWVEFLMTYLLFNRNYSKRAPKSHFLLFFSQKADN